MTPFFYTVAKCRVNLGLDWLSRFPSGNETTPCMEGLRFLAFRSTPKA